MALKRFVDGAAGEPFFQKRAPDNRPEWIRTAELTFPSGRTADEIVVDDAAGLAWVVNLGCIDLNPHPVRADDLDHPDELRVDLDPVPGVPWSQIREVALATREALVDVGLVGWPKTSGSRGIHVNVRIERRWTYPEVRRAALALARDVERRLPGAATSKWWKEERHGVFLDYNQNAKDRTVASAYSVRPLPDARVSTPLTWDEVPTVEAEAFTLDTVPARYAAIGDPGAGIDDAVGSLDALLELSQRHETEGLGDAPWPPNYAKQAGEPPRVQPSRKRKADAEYDQGRGEAGGPPPEVAAERAKAVAAGDPNAGLPDRVDRIAPDADRPAQDVHPGHRDRAGGDEGRGARRAGPLEGAASGRRGRPRTGRRPRRRDARPLVRLVPGPSQPHPRAGGGATGPGPARGRLRSVGGLRVARPLGPDRARAASTGRRVGRVVTGRLAVVSTAVLASMVAAACAASGTSPTPAASAFAGSPSVAPSAASAGSPAPDRIAALATSFVERVRDPEARYRLDQTLNVVVGQETSQSTSHSDVAGADRLIVSDNTVRGGATTHSEYLQTGGTAFERTGDQDWRAIGPPPAPEPPFPFLTPDDLRYSGREITGGQFLDSFSLAEAIPIGASVAESLGVMGGTASIVSFDASVYPDGRPVRIEVGFQLSAADGSAAGFGSIVQDYSEFGGDVVVEPPVG